jgi:DNA ligase-1
MHKKKLELKYSETPEAAQDPVFLPMLAKDFEKRKNKVVYPADVQPKLDGFRFIARWEGNSIVMRTRSGKVLEIPHIETDLTKVLPADLVVDGEVYLHGATFQQVSRLIKKWRPGESDKLKYWIYDMFEADAIDMPWSERRTLFGKLGGVQRSGPFAGVYTMGPSAESLMLVTSQSVQTEQEVYHWQKLFIEKGYEGAILRHHDGLYELGYRSSDLLKVKTFMDEEYVIVGHESGRGKFSDCVIWICAPVGGTCDVAGNTFKVVPKGTLEDKRKWLKEAKKHEGKLLKVKFFEKSDDGIPRFPVGLGMRTIK